ncbi:MAG: ribosomal protein L7/L12 [Myxococcota bacterium]
MPWGELALCAGLAVLVVALVQAFKAKPRVPLPPRGTGTMDDVRRLVSEGHKIAAIKVYREVHGVGLKEAKEAVEALER